MVLKSVLFLMVMVPALSWGLPSKDFYLSQLQEKKPWQDPQWLRLGHYKPYWKGGYRSAIEGPFFISPRGSQDPEAELKATVELFVSDPKSQCRYPARMKWLRKKMGIAKEDTDICSDRTSWKNQLGAESLYIVFAAGDLNSPPSSFGHTFLRVHSAGNKNHRELLDYGVNYAASTGDDSGALYALKGLLGYYPGMYSLMPYHLKMKEYSNIEGRDLWEYRLQLSPEDVDFLIDHLLELEGSYSSYYFLKENCSYQILELLNVARPELDLTSSFGDAAIPLDTLKVLAQEGLLADEKLRSSLKSEWAFQYRRLNFKQSQIFKRTIRGEEPTELMELPPLEQSQVLDASMSYLALEEYQQGRDYKAEKYQLAVQRARLGVQTASFKRESPTSPLLSPDSQAYYFSYGHLDRSEYYGFKYRRAFHDLLSDDSAVAAFSHLEVLSAEFRYYSEKQSADLSHLVLLKVLSTAAVNDLESAWSWKFDLGSEPRFSPYLHAGIGKSWDLDHHGNWRWALLTVSENYNLSDETRDYLGLQSLLMWRQPGFRLAFDLKPLYLVQDSEVVGEGSLSLSLDIPWGELRFSVRIQDEVPEWNLALMF